jgi:hypothetical protein
MRLLSRMRPTPRSVASLTPSAASAVGLADRGGVGDYGVAAIEPRAIATRWTSTTSTSRGSGGRAANHVGDDPRGGTSRLSVTTELRHGTQHAPRIAHQPDVHRKHEPVHDRRRLEVALESRRRDHPSGVDRSRGTTGAQDVEKQWVLVNSAE